MTLLEDRLRRAAEEVRAQARRTPPRALRLGLKTSTQPWVMVATGFAAVVLLVGLLPLLMPEESNPPGTSPTVEPTTTIDTQPEPITCSASGIPEPTPQDGLPNAVAQGRQAIIDAASECDLGRLATLAAQDFITSFGGGGFSNIEIWEEAGTGQLGTLLRVLSTSHATINIEDQPTIYVWPAAHGYDRWEDIPREMIEELRTIFTTDEEFQTVVRGGEEFGSYLSWRVGIDENGQWLFFVSGD